MRPTQWRRSTHVVIGVAVVLLVAAVVVAAALLRGRSSDASAIPPAPAFATANPEIKPVSDAADKPAPDKLAATLALTLADPNLGAFTGRITDAATGEQLWAQGADVPMQPASVTKVLTTSAALHGLDRDARLTTTVLASDRRPGVVVLKGGGDPTLSAAPKGQDSWYRDAARISDLADQVRRSGTKVTAVAVDVSAFSGPTMAPGWDSLDIDGGDIAPMEAVMLDGGRTQPVSVDSARSRTPALDAGRALAVALRVDPATVTVMQSAFEGNEIASVQSPPLVERLREMMNNSDNVMAESIGREMAAAQGKPQSFDGAVRAVLTELNDAKIHTDGSHLMDCSGLSVDDRLTAETLDETVNA
ncbi:MAG: D-alanyl-D-alanine carboxypeptidase, partial [Mycobacterium sp.]